MPDFTTKLGTLPNLNNYLKFKCEFVAILRAEPKVRIGIG